MRLNGSTELHVVHFRENRNVGAESGNFEVFFFQMLGFR